MEIGTFTKAMKNSGTRIYNFRVWISETNAVHLKNAFDVLLTNAGYGVVNFSEHHFSPQGYTAIWLLSESHLAVHTFPEEEKTYLELSGCSAAMNEKFKAAFSEQFKEYLLVEEAVS
jgi:S-adenosylmethionine/arginine decarboxylase-like enzyme